MYDSALAVAKRYCDVVAEEIRSKIILSAIKFSYAELDHRIRTLEGEVTDLKTRVERLETRWS